jgi:hypothetical protein
VGGRKRGALALAPKPLTRPLVSTLFTNHLSDSTTTRIASRVFDRQLNIIRVLEGTQAPRQHAGLAARPHTRHKSWRDPMTGAHELPYPHRSTS